MDNSKRKYIKPEIEVYQIDNEISLIMMTSETDPPDPPRGAAAPNPFDENPFNEKKE